MTRVTLAFLLGAALAAGCGTQNDAGEQASGSAAEKAAEAAIEAAAAAQGTQVDVSGGGNRISVATEGGTATLSTGSGTTLPADFPADVPVYPGAQVLAAVSSNQDGMAGHQVTFETPDTGDKVVAFYKSKVPAGMTVKGEINAGGMRTLAMATDGDDRTLAVMISEQGGKTSGTLAVARKN